MSPRASLVAAGDRIRADRISPIGTDGASYSTRHRVQHTRTMGFTDRSDDVPLRYVALGDSYTIGTAVAAADSFPSRLVAAVPRLCLAANLGVNGSTSADLIRDELPAFEELDPGFATLLIGVNDVVQGVPLRVYEGNVDVILSALLRRLPADRIVTVTVPDYTVTPGGAGYGDPRQRHDAIVAVNDAMRRHCDERGIAVVDVFDLSRRAATDRSLVADDGLHPSGAQYALWVEQIAPVVEARLAG
jgi:lysophospholipase L1-like esterase